MNGKIAVVLLSGLLFACVQAPPEPVAPPPPAPPPAPAAPPAPPPAAAAPPQGPLAEAIRENRIVVVRSAGCEPLMGLGYEDRVAAAMFYIGYTTARVGATTINVGRIPTIARTALAFCQDHPDRPVAEAFAAAYRQAR
jgi:hypothetical protein